MHNSSWCWGEGRGALTQHSQSQSSSCPLTRIPSPSLASRSNNSHIPKSCPLFLLIVSCYVSHHPDPRLHKTQQSQAGCGASEDHSGLFPRPHHLFHRMPWCGSPDPRGTQWCKSGLLSRRTHDHACPELGAQPARSRCGTDVPCTASQRLSAFRFPIPQELWSCALPSLETLVIMAWMQAVPKRQ